MDQRILDAETVIFDIGNVLMTFNINHIAKNIIPQHLIKYIHTPYFTKLWLNIDDGIGSVEGNAQLLCEYFNLDKEEEINFINLMLNFWEFCPPLPPSNCINQLKALGKKVYLLTNYGDEAFDISKKNISFLQEVDGEVVSGKEKVSKPSPEIYNILLERFNIDKSTCIYLDDRLENINGARDLGIQSILYPNELNSY
ncbi:MAG: HAD-IA family hydrolase [Spirochaetaceae bacterium]|nr:HAD-IA family hydrolase [Spirochaetaceae bacterium]